MTKTEFENLAVGTIIYQPGYIECNDEPVQSFEVLYIERNPYMVILKSKRHSFGVCLPRSEYRKSYFTREEALEAYKKKINAKLASLASETMHFKKLLEMAK